MSKRIYIAGPVSELPYAEAAENFLRAEERLCARGDNPVNPIKHCDPSWPWLRCMRECLPLLAQCDAVYMLKGWKQSRGARLEHFIALKLGYIIELEK